MAWKDPIPPAVSRTNDVSVMHHPPTTSPEEKRASQVNHFQTDKQRRLLYRNKISLSIPDTAVTICSIIFSINYLPTHRERRTLPTTKSRAWRSGGRCGGKLSGRLSSSAQRKSVGERRLDRTPRLSNISVKVIGGELTVSMSSIILENQNSQATLTI